MVRNTEKEAKIVKIVQDLSAKLSAELKEKSGNEKLANMFRQCFLSTIETTMQCHNEDEIFLITGDIEAMWLRDSSAQVVHYMKFMNEIPELKDVVKGLIKKQFMYIDLDPYANAFNAEANGRCWDKDKTEKGDDTLWNWERKYELDSLCYPVWLLWNYYQITKDTDIFTAELQKAIYTLLDTCEVEQHHEEKSPYFFIRENWPPDTLPNDGKGATVGYTGMIWCGFRPSDDACKYGYLVPANLFAVEILGYIMQIADIVGDATMKARAAKMQAEVQDGINKYGLYTLENGEKIYAYETDGLGNYHMMDDANVPGLLSIPWFTSISKTDDLYMATRRWVLSKQNPYYFEGKVAKGVGSPHTPDQYIWHIALSIQGLTSACDKERAELVDMLVRTDADTGFMHEGFHVDNPAEFTRPWFAWSNSLFAKFIMDVYDLG